MLGTFAVNRTPICDAERTRLAGPDVMPTYFDLQPAVAARRAASASSRMLLVQMTRPVIDPGCFDRERCKPEPAGGFLARAVRR
jgi:hypothetical protein